MKRVMVGMYSILAISLLGCVPEASDQELESMCDNLVTLRGDIEKPSTTIVSDVSIKFEKEAKQLTTDQQKEIESLKAEMSQKLADAEPTEKSEITADFEKRISDITAQIQPQISKIDTKKQTAIAEAKETAKAQEAAWNDAVSTCVDNAKKDSVSKKLAQCRIAADSTDKYWNVCR